MHQLTPSEAALLTAETNTNLGHQSMCLELAPDSDGNHLTLARLRAVIEEHISTGQPVGSKTLTVRRGFESSASTLRNELAWLESVGLLGHPHTSAGRVPTELGYRFYAGELLSERIAAEPMVLDLSEATQEVDDALRATTEALSQVTRLLAIASAPSVATIDVRHIEVLTLQPQGELMAEAPASFRTETRCAAGPPWCCCMAARVSTTACSSRRSRSSPTSRR